MLLQKSFLEAIVKERVQKILAQAEYGSRRACEEIIKAGRVRVNGQVITLGDKADATSDIIEVDNVKLNFMDAEKVYYAYYKPPNVLSSTSTNYKDDRPVVRDMIPVEGHLFMVGRLDIESEGLVVLTNDGDMANRLAHPRYQHTKTYKVTVYGRPSAQALEEWQNGIFLEEGKTAPCFIKVLDTAPDVTTLRIVMTEGKKRQIRRVAAHFGHPVKRLVRTYIGQLGIGTMDRGDWFQLTPEQVTAMQTVAWELDNIKKRKKALRATRWHPRPSATATTTAAKPRVIVSAVPKPKAKTKSKRRRPNPRDRNPGGRNRGTRG